MKTLGSRSQPLEGGDLLLLRLLLATFGRAVTGSGGERLAELPDPAIFALNHNNSFEVLAVPPWLIEQRGGRAIAFLIDWMFLRIPLIGWIMRRINPIPVHTKPARFRLGERGRLERLRHSPVAEAVERLAAGESIALFPEGTRNPDPDVLRRGRPGLGRIIALSDAPVIPVGIRFPSAEGRRRVPHIGRILVTVGHQLSFVAEREIVRRSGAESSRDPVLREISGVVIDRTMEAIAALCRKTYPGSNTEPGSAPDPLEAHDARP